jgi:uncharacterized protein with PQ loop repeat
MLDINCLNNLVYIGTALSILSRLCFGVIIFKNKSKNPYSMVLCLINVSSNCFWIPYSIMTNTKPLMIRSISDIILSGLSFLYILKNILKDRRLILMINES